MALLLVLLQLLPRRGVVPGRNPWGLRADGKPLLIAHGGGQGLHPPNTLAAFHHSVTSRCDVLEMDLRLTKDGLLVTHHDATIDRTSDGKGRVIDFTLAELKARNFGARFSDPAGGHPYQETPARLATLEELFARYPSMPMVVELKDREADGARAATALGALIEKYQMTPRVVVASFDDATLNEFRRVTGGRVATGTAMGETKAFVILTRLGLGWFAPSGIHALQIPVQKYGYRLDFPGLLREAHRRNMAVHYWTINDPLEMRRLTALGADGLMTDRPDILSEVLSGPPR